MRGKKWLAFVLAVALIIPNVGLSYAFASETSEEECMVEEVSNLNGEECVGMLLENDNDIEGGYLPVSYNSADEGWVTECKKQIGGTCGAYSTVACIETAMIKDELCDNSIDISERYMVLANSYDGICTSCGNQLAAGRGITLESNCPTSNWVPDIYAQADMTISYDEVVHICKIDTIVNTSNYMQYLTNNEIEIVKRAIMEYGSVRMDRYYNMTL